MGALDYFFCKLMGWRQVVVAGGLLLGMGLGLAASSLAATRIQLKFEDERVTIPLDELEAFANAGTLPSSFDKLPASEREKAETQRAKLKAALEETIDIDLEKIDRLTLESLGSKDREFFQSFIPDLTDETLQQAARGLAAIGNGKRVIDFLRAFPEETITPTHFVETLVAHAPDLPGSNGAGDVGRQPIDLNTWTQEGDPRSGNWIVSDDGTSVLQTINGRPTFFVSPTEFMNTTIRGTFEVTQYGDDDFVGFVFGYKSPIADNGDAPGKFDFLLFDWKQRNQGLDREGFRLARHGSNAEIIASDFGGDKGWRDLHQYEFELLYQRNRLKIDIDGDTIFDISASDVGGEFEPGRFGFYNQSQPNVRYSGFTEADSFPAVPEPISGLFFLEGLGLIGWWWRRKQ